MDDRLQVNHFGYAADASLIRVCDDPHIMTEEAVVPADDEGLRPVTGAPADLSGHRCPKFAHVRKMNPRDLSTDQGSPRLTLASQVLRRGITFGPPFPDNENAAASDQAERGLLFLAYQTSLGDQFEFLTEKWMNQAVGPDDSAGHDLLVGQEDASTLVATLEEVDRPSVPISLEGGWVVPTGGGYFFSPSISTLHAMANGMIPTGS